MASEVSRRNFLTQLGMTAGTAAAASPLRSSEDPA
jgi:hypothetical protein